METPASCFFGGLVAMAILMIILECSNEQQIEQRKGGPKPRPSTTDENLVPEDPFSLYRAALDKVLSTGEDYWSGTGSLNTLHREVMGLIQIQRVYHMNRTYLGQFLSPTDFYTIGTFAYQLGLYESALHWLAFAAGQSGIVNKTAETARTAREDPPPTNVNTLDESQIFERYSFLCRNENHKSTSEGMCQWSARNQNYGFWNKEVLSLGTQVTLIHDFLSTAEVQELTQKSSLQFSESETTKAHGFTDTSRISETMFMDEESGLTSKINRRIEDVTGLSVQLKPSNSDSEQLQVTLYRPGGVYEPHYDVLGNATVPEYIASSGDRLASAILYLEEPLLGGATVFPFLDLRVAPRQGSLLFWFNLKRNGDPDPWTLHAGCPVILGHKLMTAMERAFGARTLREQEHESVRHILPKTKVSNVILHENPSQERHLALHLVKVKQQKNHYASGQDLARRNFISQRIQKESRWKEEDGAWWAALKLPARHQLTVPSRPASINLLYTSPNYKQPAKSHSSPQGARGALLPYMSVSRGRTEVFQHKNETFMTRQPTALVTDRSELRRFNTFIYSHLKHKDLVLDDPRFKDLTSALNQGRESVKVSSNEENNQGNRLNKVAQFFQTPSPALPRPVGLMADGRRSVQLALPALVPSKTKRQPSG